MNTTSEPISTSASAALPAPRLRPTVSRRGGTPSVVGWVCGLGVVAGAAWFVFSLLRPLPMDESDDAPHSPPAVKVVERPNSIEARDRVLAELTRGNPFSHRRKAWLPAAVAGDGTASALDANGNPMPALPAVTLNPVQSVPADIKPAFDNLRLVGLFEVAGKPAIMISFLTGDDAARSHTFRVNDEITDKANPGAAWKVLAVHMDRKSAVLLRAGKQVELRMFKDAPLPPVFAAKSAGGVVPAAPPVVIPQTRAEIIAKLREAKISEADITAMIAELGPDPDAQPTGEATAQAIEKALKPTDAPAGSGAPAGMEEILKMMAQTRKPKPEPAPVPAPTPEKPKGP